MNRRLCAVGVVLALASCVPSTTNQEPVLEGRALTTVEDTPLDVTIAVSDPDGDELTVTVGKPTHGTLTGAGLTWRYTPAADFVGLDAIPVTVSDGELTLVGAVVEVTVTAANDAPVANDDAFAMLEDTTLELPFSALLANDEDVDGPALTVTGVMEVFGGAATLVGEKVRFVPAADFNGMGGFTYVVSDGTLSAMASARLSIGEANDAPVAVDDTATGTEDTVLELAVADLLANDTDTERQTLQVTAVGLPMGGTVALQGTTVHFTPAANLAGPASFTYTVSDGAATATGLVSLTLNGVDDAPVASPASATIAEDQVATLTLTATDIDSTTFTFAVASAPSHGSATISDGVVTYTPALNYAGSDSFTVTAHDGTSASAPVTISVTITDVIECGDGVREGSEACDDGNQSNGDACLDSCATAACGDGFVRAGVEACDDGNQLNTDACLNTCVAARCGDAFVRAGVETCDDGNQLNTDACLNTCAASSCGDGFVRAGVEACDDGNQANTDACLNTCAAASCGDAFVQAGVEACDDGNQANTDACLNTCAAASCGDAFVQAGVEACDDGNQVNTDACLNTCAAASCGDAFVQAGVEACDDGNQANTDGCLNTCVAARCGDAFVQAGIETCDDGNQVNTDACLNTCAAASCGDAFVQAGVETCDDGNQLNTDACLNTCVASSCGDGFVRAGVEACDDGNQLNTDACLNTCVAARCGDAVVQAGVETCDDGNQVNTDACLTTCAAASCGDTFVQAGVETCDDGNQVNTDACLTTCQAAACGDGFVRAGVETCDDGNSSNTDACLNVCAAASCGDGFTRAGIEQCDDGNATNTDACLNTCAAASCGDGFTRAGIEQCDDGNAANTDACLNSCTAASCGDAFVQAGVEQCDDGNAANTDACLNSCTAASCGDGFTLAGVEQCDDANAVNTDACLTSCTSASCGDGFTYGGVEQCDDGNTVDTDACTNACTPTTPPACGDNIVQAGEACDDGNTADQDGCSGACAVESCGDALVQYGLGEVCDDGNTTNNDGCSSTCQLEGGFVTVAPQKVSAALSCTLNQSNTGRKVAVDSLGNVYVAMVCGGEVYVVTSTNRGVSYGAPLALGISGVNEVAIAAGPPGVAYLAASTGSDAVFTRSTDAGASWAAAVTLASSSDFEISIEAFNDDVFVGIGGGAGVLVLHNDARGVGAFTTTDVSVSQVFFDLIYDDRRNTLMVCTDTPDFHIRVSDDRGATFAPEVNPAGMAFYSDWTVGNGTIFVAGASGGSDSLILIPASNPASSSTVLGLPYTNQSSQRALAADAVGNAFVVTLLDSGAVQLDRLPFGTTAFSAARTIVGAGSYPGISTLPTSTGAAVIYADGAGGVWATIQTY